MAKQNFVPKEAYWKEYLEDTRCPTRIREYHNNMERVHPNLKKLFSELDTLLDKTLEVCHNEKESAMEVALMRARYVLGMD